MNQKKAEYIALYSLVFGVILVFGILIRQFVLSKGIDDFSSTVAFFASANKSNHIYPVIPKAKTMRDFSL